MLIEKEAGLREKLKEVFGYEYFRGNQEAIINSLLNNHHTFVIMPTGAGKSLCYQLPAVLKPGTAIIISPLIALMKNQVDQLNSLGIRASYLNSTLNKTETQQVRKEVLNEEIKLLYVAPESLTKEDNINFLRQANISFVAIDEAHCISEWGHDFRPEYRRIRQIVDNIGDLPIIALTATATPKVQLDIQRNLRMEEANVFKSSFNRENLFYEVRPKRDSKKQLITFIKKFPNQAGIIYCLSRKKVEEIAELLRVNDIKALPYHAGLDGSVRVQNQDAFLNEDTDVIVATIAFGMGIDKPDVRFIVHYDVPKSLEGYYQETGRAGRDNKPAHCLMFYSHHDLTKIEKFNKDKPVTERDNARHLLQEIASYSESSVCRRRQLLHYFGENFDGDCGYCDNCQTPKEKYEAKNYLSLALKTVNETGEKFGISYLADILKGSGNQYIQNYGHNQLATYGQLSDHSHDFISSVFRQALLYEFLAKDYEHYGVMKLTEQGYNFLINPHSVTFSKDHDFSNTYEETVTTQEKSPAGGYDNTLFGLLKELRKKEAQKWELPPYVLFQETSLEEMAISYPTSQKELTNIHGVGQGKARKFGGPFIELIQNYVAEHDITPASHVVVKSSVNKSKSKIFIIQQIDRKVDLNEIADSLDMQLLDIIDEIEHICFSGTKLDLDYYINDFIDENRQDDLYDYFMSTEDDSIETALNELGDEYSEEEIRLMRIKIMSELGN